MHADGGPACASSERSAAVGLYAPWIRPRLLRWGATTQETTRAYPGDELVPEPDGGAMMAATLPAPAESVWSWLVQMGEDRKLVGLEDGLAARGRWRFHRPHAHVTASRST